MQFDANTSWTEQTQLCNMLRVRVPVDSTGQMRALF